MNTLFLLLALGSVLATYVTYHPFTSRPIPAALSFGVGLINGELAHWQLLLQIPCAFAFLAFADLNMLSAIIGSLLFVLSWLGLMLYMQRALSTGALIHSELQAELGKEYLEKSRLPLSGQLNERPRYRRWLKPFSPRRPNVRVHRDVLIDSEEGFDLYVDIYHHHHQPTPSPVLYQIHGGAWTQGYGDRRQQALPLMNHLAAQGWVCVTIDYRLSPRHKWPAHIIDCKKGLAWIKNNIASYGGDPDFIVATGGSAGGHLSSLLALTPNDPAFQPGFETVDTSVQACIPFYGVFDCIDRFKRQHNTALPYYLEDVVMQRSYSADPALFDAASPIQRISDQAPPFLIIHGSHDTLASAAEASEFEKQLSKISQNTVIHIEIELAQHAFELFHSPHADWASIACARFGNFLFQQHKNQPN